MRELTNHRIFSIATVLVFWVASCDKPAANSWPFQARQLKLCSMVFWKFREDHGKWPSDWNDLKITASNEPSFIRAIYFVHPDTGVKEPWLVFDPSFLSPIDESERIIAAAPHKGGNLPERANQRLVMFESGRAVWIPEELFQFGNTRRISAETKP